MKKVLVLRSSGHEVPGVDTIVTHEIVPVPQGIEEVKAFDASKAWLFITSQTTIEVLVEAGAAEVFKRKWGLRVVAGAETGKALKDAGAPGCMVPPVPGAGGIASTLATIPVRDKRILWPRGSDADPGGFAQLVKRGAQFTAPVVYEKKRRSPLDASLLAGFKDGAYGAVAVGSLAALDAVRVALGKPDPKSLPEMTWGVLGPGTAEALVENGFPQPIVPEGASLETLVALLKES